MCSSHLLAGYELKRCRLLCWALLLFLVTAELVGFVWGHWTHDSVVMKYRTVCQLRSVCGRSEHLRRHLRSGCRTGNPYRPADAPLERTPISNDPRHC